MGVSAKEAKVSTRDLLIQVTVDALDELGEPDVRLENILATSGVSVSSLYHYFGNLRGLIDAANVVRFNRVYLLDLASTRTAIDKARTKDDFRKLVVAIVHDIFLPTRSENRRYRLLALSGIDTNPEFASAIAEAQSSNAIATTELLVSAKNRGFVPDDFDPVAFGVWFSAQAFGLAVTEIADDNTMNDMWRDQTLRATLHLLGLND
jgi:AcrR family transcriptional regulator